MKSMFPLVLGLWFLAIPALAKTDRHFHHVTYHRCYHANSCFITIPGVPLIFGDILLVQLAGIHTPNILGKCEQEKKLASKARNYLNTVLHNAREIDLHEIERGENFNLVAKVLANGKNLSDLLIEKKFARPKTEDTTVPDWCKP